MCDPWLGDAELIDPVVQGAHVLLDCNFLNALPVSYTHLDVYKRQLQTRGGKRTGKASLRIAVEMATEGLITKEEAVTRVDPSSLDQLLHPTIDPKAKRVVVASGLPASPGAACGEIVFNSDEAEALKNAGRKVILVRIETSPEDIHGTVSYTHLDVYKRQLYRPRFAR